MNSAPMLQPNFDAMPQALIDIPRWVVWKGAKVPFCATAIDSVASVSDPGTWASFAQAQTAYEEGGYLGVGFVLVGDGIVGVDIDKCFHEGEPEAVALDIIGRIGCQYIERSPSGTGLRGFGYGDQIAGVRGQIDGVNVELYSSKRYLTVTGHPLRQGPLVQLPGFTAAAKAIHNNDLQKSTEDVLRKTEAIFRLPQYSSVGGLPTNTIPTQPGQRHRCLFELARYLKGVIPFASQQELRTILANWHTQHLEVVGTKEFSVTLTDFFTAWDKIKHPHGMTMKSILETIDNRSQLPAALLDLGYGTAGNQLVKICAALQAHHGENPLFLSARQAADLLGVHYTDASKMLAAIVRDGVMTLVSKGSGRTASRYRFEVESWPV
jgi:hypothetical protein